MTRCYWTYVGIAKGSGKCKAYKDPGAASIINQYMKWLKTKGIKFNGDKSDELKFNKAQEQYGAEGAWYHKSLESQIPTGHTAPVVSQDPEDSEDEEKDPHDWTVSEDDVPPVKDEEEDEESEPVCATPQNQVVQPDWWVHGHKEVTKAIQKLEEAHDILKPKNWSPDWGSWATFVTWLIEGIDINGIWAKYKELVEGINDLT